MATDVERLVVSLEASIRGFERTMDRASGVADRSARRIESRFTTMNKRMEASFLSLNRGIATAFAGAAALRGAQQLVDASTRIENSLKVAGLAGDDLSNVYDKLFASAQRNAAPIESLVTLYGRAAIVQKELGVSTQELLGFTDNVAVALRVAGTDAQTASGALLQLSQALGAGTVRAEEFNSILEGALPIAQAAAAGLDEAGGSVAKLRALVVEGKVSSEAFFRAFEAGSVILREKVAGAELTISQGFVRLQNVLIDTAGKFDTATNGSSRFAGMLDQLAVDIERLGNTAETHAPTIDRFLNFLSGAAGNFSEGVFAGTERELEAIASAVDEVASKFDRYGSSVTDAELRTAAAEQALVNFSLNGASRFGELEPVVEDFIQQLLEGRGTAESAAEAINAIGAAGDFGPLIGQLSGLVDSLFAVRSEAVATAAAVAAAQRGESAQTNINSQRAEQLANRPKPAVRPVSIAQYPVGAAAGGGGGSGGGGGGGGSSPGRRFEDALADQQRRIAEMNREIELRRQLGAAYDENGLAAERLRVQLDLENEAARAGLELTPDRQAAIAAMATAYAEVSVRLDEVTSAQEQMQQAAEDAAQTLQDGMRGFIDDLIAGKSATEALGNALKKIGGALLDSGLNALFGGLFGGKGGGGFLGGLFGGKGFATGTANTGGRRGEPRGIVHGQEAVIPLPNGGAVPVDVRMPTLPAVGNMGGEITVSGAFEVVNGSLVPVVTQISGQVAGRQIKQNNKQLPALMRDANQRMG